MSRREHFSVLYPHKLEDFYAMRDAHPVSWDVDYTFFKRDTIDEIDVFFRPCTDSTVKFIH